MKRKIHIPEYIPPNSFQKGWATRRANKEEAEKKQAPSGEAITVENDKEPRINIITNQDSSPLLLESGKPSRLAMPKATISRVVYDKELARNAKAHSYRGYLKTLNLEELKFALARDDSPKAIAFLSSLVDPANQGIDIADIALYHKIGLAELLQIWRNDRLATAMERMFAGAPDAAADTVVDARSGVACCPRCDGAGQIQVIRQEGQVWIECVNCAGKGSVRKLGDAKSRDQVFKSTGILKNEPGMSINVSTQVSSVESVIDELDRLPSIATTYTSADDCNQ